MKKKKPREKPSLKLPMVLITWEDAVCEESTLKLSSGKNLTTIPCHTVGFLLSKDKRQIVIATSFMETDDIKYTYCIPTSWITEITKLGNLKLYEPEGEKK
jgi:hypothetical protein